MKIKGISVDELKLGMYVSELDCSWLDTSFMYQGFRITSKDEIKELKKTCKTVFIDVERSVTDHAHGDVVYKQATTLNQEFSVAKNIYSTCQTSIKSTLASIKNTGKIDAEQLTSAVSNITKSIERNPTAMMLLLKMKQKDEEEFDRAIDNSVHMVTFGHFLQFPSDQLDVLGLAGMLLDIGFVKLPEALRKLPDSLTESQFSLMKTHVQHSLDLIATAPSLPEEVRTIVAQHHERLDGSGYPNGLYGKAISLTGAIAGLVNTYCAITSKRSYAEQTSPSNALGMLFKLRGSLFNEALVEQFIQCIGIYPVGSTVQLNSGEYGIVISQNLVRRLQPRVMIILDANKHPIHPNMIIDLIKEPKNKNGETYHIVRTVPSNLLPIDPDEFFLQ